MTALTWSDCLEESHALMGLRILRQLIGLWEHVSADRLWHHLPASMSRSSGIARCFLLESGGEELLLLFRLTTSFRFPFVWLVETTPSRLMTTETFSLRYVVSSQQTPKNSSHEGHSLDASGQHRIVRC